MTTGELAERKIETQVCVVGGGPAGMMLGMLLARAGLRVTVLEKHADFLRDFRGDTIHPSTLRLMQELGWLKEFLELPHSRVFRLAARFGERDVEIADFRGLPSDYAFIAFMPQWDFLDFLAEKARAYPGFELRMQTEGETLIEAEDRVCGVRARGPDGVVEIRAALTIGADGRGSVLREQAGRSVEAFGAPMDVLWFRLERRPEHGEPPLAQFARGHILVLLNRGAYWQCGFVIAKGQDAAVRAQGLPVFRARIAAMAPFLAEAAEALENWDQVKLLTVQVNRMRRWASPGLLFIGDAAHAMSPVGGVGVNLAIQDAVAAANILAEPLSRGADVSAILDQAQARRDWPTRMTQRLQLLMQTQVISGVLSDAAEPPTPPRPMRLADHFPPLRRLIARVIGIGVRSEHIRSPEAPAHSAAMTRHRTSGPSGRDNRAASPLIQKT